MVGGVDDAMGLSVARLKDLSRVDDRNRIGVTCENRDRPPQDVERVSYAAVEVPSYFLSGCEDHVMDPDVIGREHWREGLHVLSAHVVSVRGR